MSCFVPELARANEIDGDERIGLARRARLIFQQQLDAAAPERFLVDGHGRKRRRALRGGGNVVETDERDVIRHAQPVRETDAHRGEGRCIVIGENRVGQGTGLRAGVGDQALHRVGGGEIGGQARLRDDFERRIEKLPGIEIRLAIAERALRDAVMRERSADERDAPPSLREQMLHGERRAFHVVDIDRAKARRAQIDEHGRPRERMQMREQFRLDEARDRDGVGRVQAHLLREILRRAGGEHRRHEPPLAARFLEAVQHVREKRADGEIVVLPMQQKSHATNARAQLPRVVAELLRDFDDAHARRFGQARLILERARNRPDRDACRARDIANGGGHRGVLCLRLFSAVLRRTRCLSRSRPVRMLWAIV